MKTAQRLIAAFLPFLFVSASAQSDTATRTQPDSALKTRPQLKLSLNYSSTLHFYGRTDSLKSSGFFPLAEFWPTSKFYVNAAPVFVNNAVQQFDYAGTVATVGYLNISKRWITSAYVSKPFYKPGSGLVQSALDLQSGASVSFLNRYVNLTAGGTLNLSGQTDYGASGGVDHLFRIPLKQKAMVVLDPSFVVYAGTQNFQRSYTRKVSTGSPLLPRESEELVTENVSRFSVLSYEASLLLIYIQNKWTFVATPAYVLPQNLVTVQDRPDLSERGTNLFYATLTAKYSF